MNLRKERGFHPSFREQPFSLTQYVSDLPILHRAQAAERRPVFLSAAAPLLCRLHKQISPNLSKIPLSFWRISRYNTNHQRAMTLTD